MAGTAKRLCQMSHINKNKKLQRRPNKHIRIYIYSQHYHESNADGFMRGIKVYELYTSKFHSTQRNHE